MSVCQLLVHTGKLTILVRQQLECKDVKKFERTSVYLAVHDLQVTVSVEPITEGRMVSQRSCAPQLFPVHASKIAVGIESQQGIIFRHV